MEWIALTMIRLYEVTDEAKYLDTAKQLWNWIKEGWNEEYCNGGIAWNHGDVWSKNACSNGPAGLIACRLYQIEKWRNTKNGLSRFTNGKENICSILPQELSTTI